LEASRHLAWGPVAGEGGNTEIILGERRAVVRLLSLQCVLALKSCKVSDQAWDVSRGKTRSAAAIGHWPPSTWPVATVVVIMECQGTGLLFAFSVEAGKTCSKESWLGTLH